MLKPGGLIFVLVKKGDGRALIDTCEGLGKRFYRMYTHDSPDDILSRNGFVTLEKIDKIESRNKKTLNG